MIGISALSGRQHGRAHGTQSVGSVDSGCACTTAPRPGRGSSFASAPWPWKCPRMPFRPTVWSSRWSPTTRRCRQSRRDRAESGARLGRGGLQVSMSTVSRELVRTLAEQHSRAGAALVSAPVFGRPDAGRGRQPDRGGWPARIRTSSARARCWRRWPVPFTTSVPSRRPATSQSSPSNLMVLSSVEMLAEVLELAARGGVDRRAHRRGP